MPKVYKSNVLVSPPVRSKAGLNNLSLGLKRQKQNAKVLLVDGLSTVHQEQGLSDDHLIEEISFVTNQKIGAIGYGYGSGKLSVITIAFTTKKSVVGSPPTVLRL